MESWGQAREQFPERLAVIDALKAYSDDLARDALRFTIDHPAMPVAIPGARTPLQAQANARAGYQLLNPDQRSAMLGKTLGNL